MYYAQIIQFHVSRNVEFYYIYLFYFSFFLKFPKNPRGWGHWIGKLKNLALALYFHHGTFSEIFDVGTLDLCLETPGTMQKEMAQSDHPARRKHPKCGLKGTFKNIQRFINILDVFSGQGNRIELISFPLCQASWDTSLEYPHQIFLRMLKFWP